MSNKPVESARWDWMAAFDRKIARRAKAQAKQTQDFARFSYGQRFTAKVWHSHLQEWFDHGPCQVVRLTRTHLHYWHEGYDQPPPQRRPWQWRRMPRTELRQLLQMGHVTFH